MQQTAEGLATGDLVCGTFCVPVLVRFPSPNCASPVRVGSMAASPCCSGGEPPGGGEEGLQRKFTTVAFRLVVSIACVHHVVVAQGLVSHSTNEMMRALMVYHMLQLPFQTETSSGHSSGRPQLLFSFNHAHDMMHAQRVFECDVPGNKAGTIKTGSTCSTHQHHVVILVCHAVKVLTDELGQKDRCHHF